MAIEIVPATGVVKLTNWDYGDACYLDRSQITTIQRLPATKSGQKDITARTQIYAGQAFLMVNETPEEIMSAK